MSKFYYADSSSLVKRHVAEIGSHWVRNEFNAASGNIVITAKISVVEVLSALNRRQREAALTTTDYQDIAKDFLKVIELEYETIEITDAVLLESKRLLEVYPLRAGDAVQLASAIISQNLLSAKNLSPLTFLASDVRLLNAAQGEGLITDDPQNHP
ncbi:MAG: type II toxin-antitoxin system VapC family toxin [Pyrinomonadaceae bacterium]